MTASTYQFVVVTKTGQRFASAPEPLSDEEAQQAMTEVANIISSGGNNEVVVTDDDGNIHIVPVGSVDSFSAMKVRSAARTADDLERELSAIFPGTLETDNDGQHIFYVDENHLVTMGEAADVMKVAPRAVVESLNDVQEVVYTGLTSNNDGALVEFDG